MTSHNQNINNPQWNNNIAQQSKDQTSIVLQKNQLLPHTSINIESIVKQATKPYHLSNSKQRYVSARTSLPLGNFDWTQHRSNSHKSQQIKIKKQWSWKSKLLFAVLVIILAGSITYLIVYQMSNHSQKSLHEQSVNPRIPSFQEINGKMNAPKIQPLINMDDLIFASHQQIFHLRNY